MRGPGDAGMGAYCERQSERRTDGRILEGRLEKKQRQKRKRETGR